MKASIRIGFAFLCLLVVGAAFLRLASRRHVSLIAADQPQAARIPYDRRLPATPHPPIASSANQIVLHTTVIDIDEKKLAEAGIELPKFIGQQPEPAPNSAEPQPGCSLVPRREAELLAKLIRTSGAGKILAEPTVVTTDSRPASFHSGGEFPIIVPQNKDAVAVEYRRFGTSLDFTPKKLANGKLRLEIRIEQAEIDHSRTVTVGETNLPGLKTRQIDTAIEMESGQTALLAELRGEQILVFVTPEFVAPMNATVEQACTPIRGMRVQPGMDVQLPKGNKVVLNGVSLDLVPTVAGEQGTIEARADLKLQQLLAQFGPNHPKVLELKTHIAAFEKHLSAAAKAKADVKTREAEKQFAEFQHMITEVVSSAKVNARRLPTGVLLSGSVADARHVNVIIQIAEQYFPQVINNLTVTKPAPDLPAFAPQVSQPQPNPLGKELRELREDVRVLRRDVGRLIEILAEDNDKALQAAPDKDDRSSATSADDVDDLAWRVIGIRVEEAEFTSDKYRGGLQVVEVRSDSPAAAQGIRVGDILVGLDRWEMLNRKNLSFVLGKIGDTEQESLRFYVLRGGEMLFGNAKLEWYKDKVGNGLEFQLPVGTRLEASAAKNDLLKVARETIEQPEKSKTPAAAAETPLPGSASIPDPTVELKAGDRLTVESLVDPKLSRHVSILEDGTVTLPLLGQVPATGRTLLQFSKELTQQYNEFYKEPGLIVSFFGTCAPLAKGGPGLAIPVNPATPPNANADLKRGDRLSLESPIEPKLNRRLTILGDGTLTLPWLGQVPAAGRTLTTLKGELEARYREHYHEPSLTLSFLGTSLPLR